MNHLLDTETLERIVHDCFSAVDRGESFIAAFEREIVLHLANRMSRRAVAMHLNIPKSTIYDKIKRWNTLKS